MSLYIVALEIAKSSTFDIKQNEMQQSSYIEYKYINCMKNEAIISMSRKKHLESFR